MARRIPVLVLSLVLFVLVSEGVLSLLLHRSWTDLFRERSFLESLADPLLQTDAARFAAAVGGSCPTNGSSECLRPSIGPSQIRRSWGMSSR